MKLFENGVGRPSNEIKKKRRIFIASVVTIIALLLVVAGVLLFGNSDTSRLQGAAYSVNEVNFAFDSEITVNGTCAYSQTQKLIKIKLKKMGSKVDHVKVVACKSKERCTDGNAWDNALVLERGLITKVGKEELYLNTDSTEFNPYYLRISTYDKEDTILRTIVYEIKPKKEKVKWEAGFSLCGLWDYQWGSIVKEKWYVSKKETKLTLTCPSKVDVNKEFNCTTNQSGVKITVGGAKALASNYSPTFTTTSKDMTKTIKYTDKLFTTHKKYIKKDSSNKKEYINATITAKKGNETVKKIVKIYKKTKDTTKLTLTCPSKVDVNKKFNCTTNQSGVKITVGGAKALASNYSPTFTTTSGNKTKDIKYTNKLFSGDWKIREDDNKKEYVNATITAKKGKETVKKIVKIYRENSSFSGAITKPDSANTTQAINITADNKTNTTANKKDLAAISFKYSLSGSGKTKTIKIKPTKYGTKVKYDSYVMCESYNDCINSNAWTNMNNKYKGTQNPTTNRNIARVNKTESVWINTSYKGIANKKYYLRITTYSNDNASNWLYVGVFEFVVDSKNNVKVTNVYNNFR